MVEFWGGNALFSPLVVLHVHIKWGPLWGLLHGNVEGRRNQGWIAGVRCDDPIDDWIMGLHPDYVKAT